MSTLTQANYEIKALGHLGLVAGTLQKVQLAQQIDKMLPLNMQKGAKLSHGKRVEGMICNALGFIDTPLYMFSEFLANKPVEQLLGKACHAKDFTDDALGRTLDDIASYGATNFFATLSFAIAKKFNLWGKTLRTDTTSLIVYGDYPEEREPDFKAPRPKFGYSKDRKPEYKQLIMYLATTGVANFPILAATESGNVSDTKSLPDMANKMKTFCQRMDIPNDFIYVGDSAFYTGAVKMSKEIVWLSRVPQTLKECTKMVALDDKKVDWQPAGEGYKIACFHIKSQEVKQRWLLVSSEKAYKKEVITLQKKITKEAEECSKQAKKLKKIRFNCQKDAQTAAKKLKKLKFHHFAISIEPIMGFTSVGRPKNREKPEIKGYQLLVEVEKDKFKIKQEANKKGRFVLATNEFDEKKLSAQELLWEYKKQVATEQGFAFIKDKTFEVSSVFLKKPSRIQALMAVMALSLLTYSLCQYFIRTELKIRAETVRNQVKKQIQNPSAKWIFFLFMGVTSLKVTQNGQTQQFVTNLNPLLERIISYLGEETEQIYGLVG